MLQLVQIREQTEIKVQVEKVDTTFKIWLVDSCSPMGDKLEATLEVNLAEIFSPYTRFIFFLNNAKKFTNVYNYDEISSVRDGMTTLYSFSNSSKEPGEFSLFFGETIEDILFISFYQVIAEDTEVEHVPGYNIGIICERYPQYKDKLFARDNRRDMLYHADPNNSLAYIEAQLDTLTKIVIDMANLNPALKTSIENFDEFSAAFSKTNLFKVKSFARCINEIKEQKAKIRNLQIDYYKKSNDKDIADLLAPPTLEQRRAAKKDQINHERNAREQSTFEYNGYIFDCDSLSSQRITIAVQTALAAKLIGQDIEIPWTLADNSIVNLNADDLIALASALAEHGAAVHAAATTLKKAADEANCESALDAITWPEV